MNKDLRRRTEELMADLNELEFVESEILTEIAEQGGIDEPSFALVLGTWDCPKSPAGYCVYNRYTDPARDNCLFCHEPAERK